jgi:hypothetical protein
LGSGIPYTDSNVVEEARHMLERRSHRAILLLATLLAAVLLATPLTGSGYVPVQSQNVLDAIVETLIGARLSEIAEYMAGLEEDEAGQLAFFENPIGELEAAGIVLPPEYRLVLLRPELGLAEGIFGQADRTGPDAVVSPACVAVIFEHVALAIQAILDVGDEMAVDDAVFAAAVTIGEESLMRAVARTAELNGEAESGLPSELLERPWMFYWQTAAVDLPFNVWIFDLLQAHLLTADSERPASEALVKVVEQVQGLEYGREGAGVLFDYMACFLQRGF